MPRSWKPVELLNVVCVSPDPDLVDACAPMSRLPTAAVSSENTVSLDPVVDPDIAGSTLMLPPALKNALIVALSANVTDLSIVEVLFHVPELVDVPIALVESAVAPVEPAATAAAKLARSVINADLIAIVSPAETDDAVIDVFVWLAMLSMPVNNEFQCEALIVSPAETVAIVDWFSPYSPDPGPAKWLYPNGLELLFTNALYSSSKIVSPAEYAIFLLNPYYALCQCCYFVVFILDQSAQCVKSVTFLNSCHSSLTVSCTHYSISCPACAL